MEHRLGALGALLIAAGFAVAVAVNVVVGPIPEEATVDPAAAAPVLERQAPLLALASLLWGAGFLLILYGARRGAPRSLVAAGFLGGLGGLTMAPGVYLLAEGLARYMEEASTKAIVDEETVLSLTMPGLAVFIGSVGVIIALALLALEAWRGYTRSRNTILAVAALLLAGHIAVGLALNGPLTGDPVAASLGLAGGLLLGASWWKGYK